MLLSRLRTDESGSASLEFITVGLIMLVPLVYLLIAVASVQSAAFAIEGGARQAARVFVEGASEQDAEAMAIRAVEFALADHGLTNNDVQMSVTCTPQPDVCLTRGGFVTVRVELYVPLPLAPPVLGEAFSIGVPLSATATQRVSRFWGSG
ncbi:MAG: hypothetical protein ACOH19_12485 [Rhodoglobus sp.]